MVVGALLFDLDGTLVDSERESAEAMARALLSEGIQIDQEDRDFIIGRSWVQIYEQLKGRYPAILWTRDELIAATASKREEVFAESGITILPGAVEAVRRFQLPRAVITGSSRVEARQAIDALGLADEFEFIIASEDVQTSKPSPDGYLQAAKRLGVDPLACVVIEDSVAGIAAGVSAQMRVIAVRVGNFAGHDQSAAHVSIATLEELDGDLLARMMEGAT